MNTQILTKDEVKQKMEEIEDWIHQSTNIPDTDKTVDMLFKMYPFENFKEAKKFTDEVSDTATNLEHYPSITIAPNYVTIMIGSPDTQDLTEKDFKLAKKIDKLNQPAMGKEKFAKPEDK